MGVYKYIHELWKKPKSNELYKQRLIVWRKEPAIVKVERPTRLDRARALGYRAKQGYVLARVCVLRGGRKREQIKKGRRTKHRRRVKIVDKSYQWVAEERAQKKFHNLEVLNSYFVGKDGQRYWYEIILVNPYDSSIIKDSRINWISKKPHTKRVVKGLTSTGKKSRGLRNKGKGAEKLRPSRTANLKRRRKQ